MSIANDVHKNISQPHRGGMRLRWAIHAAPMGLGRIMGRDGCYKHGALTELGRGWVNPCIPGGPKDSSQRPPCVSVSDVPGISDAGLAANARFRRRSVSVRPKLLLFSIDILSPEFRVKA